jgi:hypothetical protein
MGIVRRRYPKSIAWHQASGIGDVFRCAPTVAQRHSDDVGAAIGKLRGAVGDARDERRRERPRRPIMTLSTSRLAGEIVARKASHGGRRIRTDVQRIAPISCLTPFVFPRYRV